MLDFDDAPGDDNQPSGLAATTLTSTPAAASLLAGTSTNPLDDLVSIFGNVGLSGASAGATKNSNDGNALASLGVMSPTAAPSPASTFSPVTPSQNQQKPQDDLLGLF